MSGYVPAALRRLVVERANRLCEYCLIHEDDAYFDLQVEHVIAEKHGGLTVAENLAYACVYCNRYKGSDIASVSPTSGQLCRLVDPRTDRWAEHFALHPDGVTIRPLTAVGEVTARLLAFNNADRLGERRVLRDSERYPAPAALPIVARVANP